MTKAEIAKLPRELPENPDGWTKHMLMHLNRGREGHVGVFEIHDASGTVMPFTFSYNTNKKNPTRGFTVTGREKVLSWAELRKHWPSILAWLDEKAAA